MNSYYLSILALVTIAVTSGCKKNSAPAIIDFTYQGTLHTGYLISFHTDARTCLWSFGDGSQSVDASPNHTYAYASTFTVTMVPDNEPKNKITKTIVIAPAFDFTYSGVPAAGHPLIFSTDADPGSTYLWNFGDGTISNEATPQHAFATNSLYDVSLILDNNSDHTIMKVVTIFVNGIYLASITGSKTWHHVYTDASPYPPYHTRHPMPDVTMSIDLLSPSAIIIGSDTLTYNSATASDSVLEFDYSNIYRGLYYSLYFNHFTSAIDYYKYKHISAASGEASDHYYTP